MGDGLGGGGVMFFSHFMLDFQHLQKKKIWEYKTIMYPLHLQLLVKWEVVSPSSRYREFYHEIGNIEKCPFTYWLNRGGGILQIVDIHVGNLNMEVNSPDSR